MHSLGIVLGACSFIYSPDVTEHLLRARDCAALGIVWRIRPKSPCPHGVFTLEGQISKEQVDRNVTCKTAGGVGTDCMFSAFSCHSQYLAVIYKFSAPHRGLH